MIAHRGAFLLKNKKRIYKSCRCKTALFEYIEIFYNRKKIHSAIGYKTSSQFEKEFAA
ncbi:IS3 family transposase [Leptospira interrogans]|uniref:IS3 family transposase n=1 Tax=Leptospira interrogans TaxID=173 RepID=UPI000AD7B7D8|nr:IS3 family transposase [Leptospira interrogans]